MAREVVTKPTGVYIYDIEQFKNFFSISFKDKDTGVRHKFIMYHDYRNPKLSINDFAKLIEFIETRIMTLIGYNNLSYDDLMVKHIIINKVIFMTASIVDIVMSMKNLSDRIIGQQKMEKMTGQKDKYINGLKSQRKFGSMDLLELFNTIDRVSLKQIAVNLKWPNIIDLPFHPDHIVVREEIDNIMVYNDNDVDITEALLLKKEPDLKFRKDLGGIYKINIINSNDTNVAKAIVRKFYNEETGLTYDDYKDKRTFYKTINLYQCVSAKVRFMTVEYQKLLNIIRNTTILPSKDEAKNTIRKRNEENKAGAIAQGLKFVKEKEDAKQFEYIMRSKYLTHTIGLGGIHSNNPAEELRETDDYEYIDADVASFYPWIIVNENLFPKHLGPEFIRAYRDKIIKKRIEIKELWLQNIDYEVNKTIDEGLKKTANSTYGLTKSMYSFLYDPLVTTYVCITGQLYLLMLIERLEELTDCVVVYSNTDGITTKVPKYAKDDYFRICHQWERRLGFKLEFVNYRRMLMKDINNYMMVTNSETKPVKQIGLFLTKKKLSQAYDYPIIAKALENYYVRNVPIDVTIKSETDVFEFMKAERTSTAKYNIYLHPKLAKEDDKPVKLQKTNRWIVTNGFSEEGRIMKYSKVRVDANNRPHGTNMQKGRMLTLVNDASRYTDITKLNIDYEFYISECYKIIKDLKIRNVESHNISLKQGSLF